MAGSSLFALIDDIATVLDDVAVMSKVAAKKTAGVLGDDLALNAQQVTGIAAERELPVVWAVALGSLRNKAILVPAALVISALLPQAILPLLMLGGAYLCFEGVEKLAHRFLHSADEDATHRAEHLRALGDANVDLVAYERDKVQGAIRTDFILSAEIIVITLGTVGEAIFATRVMVLVGIALAMTVGVYGFVAAIVKLDDVGLYLMRRDNAPARRLGGILVAAAPRLMKLLSVVGTLAMFLVGGGILAHGLPFAHHAIHDLTTLVGAALPHGLHGVLELLVPLTAEALLGVAAGALVLGALTAFTRLRRRAGA
jgi:predicted DNA repair protein MutK